MKTTKLKAKVTAYSGVLVIECLETVSSEDCTLSTDNPTCIGQVIHNTKKNLGISKEAVEVLRKFNRCRDDIGDIDFFESDDKQWNFAWIGGLKKIADPKDAVGSRTYSVPGPDQYVSIPNDVPQEAKDCIDEDKAAELGG